MGDFSHEGFPYLRFMKRQTVTIKDIARELGISPSTVSRALKDHFEISEETKKAVREVAEKLNYQPNSLALSLRYSKSNTIGVIIPEIVHFFFSTVISGIEDIAHSRGYNVIITQSNESMEREMANLQTLFNNRVDGVLISISKETNKYTHLESVIQKGLPLVFFDRVAHGLKCSKVTVDDFMGGYQATQHLIQQGYKKIMHLGGPEYLDISHRRMEGYKKAHQEAGIEIDEDMIIFDMISNDQATQDLVFKLLTERKPDSVFAFTDMAALTALRAAYKLGKSVPDDFGVVGFSNWQFTAFTSPSISTVEQPGFELGQHATELLLNQIESEEEQIKQESIVLPTAIIPRESSNRIS